MTLIKFTFWLELSVSQKLLEFENFSTKEVRLLPDCGFIDSVCDYVPKTDDQNRSEVDKDGVPILKIRQESKIKFSEVSRGQWWPSDCTDRNET